MKIADMYRISGSVSKSDEVGDSGIVELSE